MTLMNFGLGNNMNFFGITYCHLAKEKYAVDLNARFEVYRGVEVSDCGLLGCDSV
jgi:hypothetical protein